MPAVKFAGRDGVGRAGRGERDDVDAERAAREQVASVAGDREVGLVFGDRGDQLGLPAAGGHAPDVFGAVGVERCDARDRLQLHGAGEDDPLAVGRPLGNAEDLNFPVASGVQRVLAAALQVAHQQARRAAVGVVDEDEPASVGREVAVARAFAQHVHLARRQIELLDRDFHTRRFAGVDQRLAVGRPARIPEVLGALLVFERDVHAVIRVVDREVRADGEIFAAGQLEEDECDPPAVGRDCRRERLASRGGLDDAALFAVFAQPEVNAHGEGGDAGHGQGGAARRLAAAGGGQAEQRDQQERESGGRAGDHGARLQRRWLAPIASSAAPPSASQTIEDAATPPAGSASRRTTVGARCSASASPDAAGESSSG